MTEPIRGHRDARSDSWSWGPADRAGPKSARRLRWVGLIAASVGAALAVAGLVLLISESGDGDSSGAAPATRPPVLGASRTPTATSGGRESPTSTPSPQPPSPTPSIDSGLFVWSRQGQRWLDSDLSDGSASYREGEAVPFMLRIDDADPGTVYEVELAYECRTRQGAAFDYLTGLADADAGAAGVDPGPLREREDASIPIPDDATIDFDGGNRRFAVWGGSFQETPEGPLPAAVCEEEKQFHLDLIAHDETLFLIWGGHLALSSDWGENEGASSQSAPIHMQTSVDGGDRHRRGVGPGVAVR